MKIIYLLLSAVCTFLFFSCSNHPYENQKQSSPDNSESAFINKPVIQERVNDTFLAKVSVQPKYQYPNDNGIGPIKEVALGTINSKLVASGKKIFTVKCSPCHQMDTRLVGPPLRNITKKNTPQFIMNYLLNTSEMQKKDPLLVKLVDEYKVIMPDQQLSKDDARSLLEYFRSTEK
jgi:cytochrome c551/c552